MPNENNQIPFETNPSFLDSTKKVLFNINWDLNTGGVRQLEIDAFKCLNSNINNIYNAPQFVGSPIDGTTTKSDVTLFIARKRMIQLIDIWNRILNSGLFLTSKYTNSGTYPETKIVGANLNNPLTEYFFKDLNTNNVFIYPLNFKTDSIFYKLVRFIIGSVQNYNWYITNNIINASYYSLTSIGPGNVQMGNLINTNFNPNTNGFISLMNELIAIVKDLIDETKLASALTFNFASMDFGTQVGRTNLLALDAYKSNYKALARIDTSYLNDDTKLLYQEWINTNSNKLTLLYPQFGTLISRNTESETWNFRNVAIDTAPYNPLDLNPNIDPALKPYQTRYLLCSQLDMKRPLVFNTQFINWANENDRPYVMLYNGGTLIYIPDEIKESSTLNTLGEQPDNQLNLSAYFWKIGTSNNLDPNYNNTDDIKLKLPDGKNLYDIDKLDFLDNLTIYLKLN